MYNAPQKNKQINKKLIIILTSLLVCMSIIVCFLFLENKRAQEYNEKVEKKLFASKDDKLNDYDKKLISL